MMEETLEGIEAWQRTPTEELRRSLNELHWRMKTEQNEYRNIPYGALRLITDSNLLLFEYALSCVLARGQKSARGHIDRPALRRTVRFEPGNGFDLGLGPFGSGLADFWVKESGLTLESLTQPKASKVATVNPSPSKTDTAPKGRSTVKFTPRRGSSLRSFTSTGRCTAEVQRRRIWSSSFE